ncbi:MAG: hypothetical protein EOM37_07405 [Proteobacteria bacterium]|jgi:hypothetical protein|nr:hypothetical protein [Alphaproteobacteria bacterium]NCC03856.1 hypothetical protein [Pseudomonadota bacterium]
MIKESLFLERYLNRKSDGIASRRVWIDMADSVLDSFRTVPEKYMDWGHEACVALCAASYYFFNRHVPDTWKSFHFGTFEKAANEHCERRNGHPIRGNKEVVQNYIYAHNVDLVADLLGKEIKDVRRTVRLVEIDCGLAKLSCDLLPGEQAYRELQDSFFEALIKVGASPKPQTKRPEHLLSTAYSIFDAARAYDKGLFAGLPEIHLHYNPHVPLENPSSYVYRPDDQLNIAHLYLSSQLPVVAKNDKQAALVTAHEAEHVLQAYLGHAYHWGLIDPSHPLFCAARNFRTFEESEAAFGAQMVNPALFPHIKPAQDYYLATPREKAAHGLSNRLKLAWNIG